MKTAIPMQPPWGDVASLELDRGVSLLYQDLEDLNKILFQFSELAAEKVRKKIDEKGLVDTGVMRASIYAEVDKSKLTIYLKSHKEYTQYLDRGVKPHVMSYLLGKPMPFVSAGGGALSFAGPGGASYGKSGTFFRKVTPASIAAGSWFHPGIKAHNFYREGIQEAINEFQKSYPYIIFEFLV